MAKTKTKKKKFAEGDRVGCVETYRDEFSTALYHPDDEVSYGTVTKVHINDTVFVKWDDAVHNSWASGYPVDIKDLSSEDELKEKYKGLEAKFKLVEKEVKAAVAVAAKSLRDAQKIARKAGFDLSDLYNATAPLENAMDACGWRTSSLHC